MQSAQYHVVKLLATPSDSANEFVCVPKDWIWWHGGTSQHRVVVAYPEEGSSVTIERVRNNEGHSEDWNMHKALHVCSKDTFEEALNLVIDMNLPSQLHGLTLEEDDLRGRDDAPAVQSELAPETGVFIDAEKLKKIKKQSKSYNKLARSLMVEIYTDSELIQCTLAGVGKPALDQNKLNAIVKCVELHGIEKGWENFNERDIKKSLGVKLCEIRRQSLD